jgi:hypothetical protein
MTPDECIKQRGTSELIRLQKNLNASFVKRRDRMQPIGALYKYLRQAEDELSRRGAIWFGPPRRPRS